MQAFFYVLFVLVVISSNCRAASFDCKKASHNIEIMICSDDELSKMDEKLAEAYNANLVNGDEKTKAILKSNQISWIKHTRSLVNRNNLESYQLANLYNRRIRDLKHSLFKLDDLIIVSKDKFKQHKLSTHAVRRLNMNGGHYYEQNSRYPQIAYPINIKTTAWNAYIKQKVETNAVSFDGNPDTQYYLSFNTPYLSSGILSTTISLSKYGAGAAHGSHYNISSHYVLDDSREATVEDYFNPASAWKSDLATYVINDIC